MATERGGTPAGSRGAGDHQGSASKVAATTVAPTASQGARQNVGQFPRKTWPQFRRILQRGPLRYRVVRQVGSHIRPVSPTYPTLHLAFHERATIPPGLVRKILVRYVGLTEDDALRLLR